MRRVAASRVYTSIEEFYNNHIVELFDSFVVNHYSLQSELAMTEWLGGIIVLTHADIPQDQFHTINSVSDLYTLSSLQETTIRPQAYHISNPHISSATLSPTSRITKLVDMNDDG